MARPRAAVIHRVERQGQAGEAAAPLELDAELLDELLDELPDAEPDEELLDEELESEDEDEDELSDDAAGVDDVLDERLSVL